MRERLLNLLGRRAQPSEDIYLDVYNNFMELAGEIGICTTSFFYPFLYANIEGTIILNKVLLGCYNDIRERRFGERGRARPEEKGFGRIGSRILLASQALISLPHIYGCYSSVNNKDYSFAGGEDVFNKCLYNPLAGNAGIFVVSGVTFLILMAYETYVIDPPREEQEMVRRAELRLGRQTIALEGEEKKVFLELLDRIGGVEEASDEDRETFRQRIKAIAAVIGHDIPNDRVAADLFLSELYNKITSSDLNTINFGRQQFEQLQQTFNVINRDAEERNRAIRQRQNEQLHLLNIFDRFRNNGEHVREF